MRNVWRILLCVTNDRDKDRDGKKKKNKNKKNKKKNKKNKKNKKREEQEDEQQEEEQEQEGGLFEDGDNRGLQFISVSVCNMVGRKIGTGN